MHMKRERLYRIPIKQLKNVMVDYYLTVDEEALYEKYGICLVKTTDYDMIEEYVTVNHVCRSRKEAQDLIARLAKGEVMPVSLSDIIDDYLAQKE